jgi:hypothetical protein
VTLNIFDSTNAGFFAVDLNHETSDVLGVVIQKFAGSFKTVAQQTQDLARRSFNVPFRSRRSEANAIDEFWRLNNYGAEPVFFRDPRLGTRTGVSLGTATSNQTVFSLPSTGENSRDYPIGGLSSTTVYDDGGSVTVSTINTDNRTFTLASAPASDSVMTSDYRFYRKVRMVGEYRWRSLGVDWLTTQIPLQEEP